MDETAGQKEGGAQAEGTAAEEGTIVIAVWFVGGGFRCGVEGQREGEDAVAEFGG